MRVEQVAQPKTGEWTALPCLAAAVAVAAGARGNVAEVVGLLVAR